MIASHRVSRSIGQKAAERSTVEKCKALPASFFLLFVVPSALGSSDTLACKDKSPDSIPQARTVGVLTLNLHEVQDSNVVLRSLRLGEDFGRTDLMLLQEVVHPGRDKRGIADRLAQSLGMQVFFVPAFDWRNGGVQGLAILSRYPILEQHVIPLPQFNLRWRSRKRIALAAVVETPGGYLRVYNVHLDTRLNLDQRLAQLRPVVEEASTAPGPVLVAGDFNTNPYRWFQHSFPLRFGAGQPVGVQQYLARSGFQSALPGKSVTSRWLKMQLDWIFLRGLRVEGVANRRMKFSDHHAIYACLDLPAEPGPQPLALEGPQ